VAVSVPVASPVAVRHARAAIAVTISHPLRATADPVRSARGTIRLDADSARAIASSVMMRRTADREAGDAGDGEEGNGRCSGERRLQRPP
jgi:hypothetical protein